MKRMLLSLVVVWAAAVAGADVVNPLKRENAPDPFTTYDAASGWYYHIHSDNPTDGSGGFTADRVVLHRSREAGRLLNADESRVVYRANAADGVFGYLWAPEMHRAPNGKWYVYTSCTRKKEGGDKRLLILEAKTDDPFDGFVVKSFPDESAFAIDPTVFTASDGRQYICYSEVKAGKGQVLQIREMTNPWTFGPRQAELAIADLPWELVPPYDKAMILEGAFFVQGKTPDALSIVYSANGCWSQGYCLGVLDYQGGDLCDAKSWRKRPRPVFKSGNGVFGPGHASFFRSPDGTELWVSYHFLSHANPTHLPTDRLFALQRFNVDAARGLPAETAPVRPGDRRSEPSAVAGLAFARDEFARYVGEITGRAAPAAEFRVDPTLDAKHDEYRIRSAGDSVSFSGANGRALQYAVYDFLERRGGCRWFWDGDVVPKRDAIDYSGLDVSEKSRFEYRAIRYFAHRGLTRFQAEHWGLEDWKREIDWCVKRRLNCLMPRIGMDDTWQKAFPGIVPYPDPAKKLRAGGKGYDNRDLFWPLQYRGELRKAFTDYAFGRGLMIPTDFGTMTHWYSRTPQEFLDAKDPPFLPQATSGYGEKTGLVWDVFQGEWLEDYWRLTQTFMDAGYGRPDLLHTIGLGERLCFRDRAKNLKMKTDVMGRLFALANAKSPDSKILLAGWDFYSSWSAAEVRSLIPRLDPEKVLIWDYEADAVEGWDYEFQCLKGNFTHWDVVGKFPYTFGIFLAYERALDIRANYPLIEARQKLVEDDPMCKGYILWPESSHTDIFALRYFTANAWTGGRAAADLLPEFCRDRYGEQAGEMEEIWRRTIPISSLVEWYGNFAAGLTENPLTPPEDNLWSRPLTDWLIALKDVEAVFAALARVRWRDEFVRRDSVDLARTLLDRLIEARRLHLVQAYGDWTKGKVRNAVIVRGLADDYVRLVSGMTRLLALHTDYSLADSYDRLAAVHPIANPDFGHVLVDNAVNAYCRSHQYEAAAFWYEPLARDCAAAIAAKLDADDRTPIDGKALADKSAAYHAAMLARPLAEMRPAAPRTETAFAALMEELAGSRSKDVRW